MKIILWEAAYFKHSHNTCVAARNNKSWKCIKNKKYKSYLGHKEQKSVFPVLSGPWRTLVLHAVFCVYDRVQKWNYAPGNLGAMKSNCPGLFHVNYSLTISSDDLSNLSIAKVNSAKFTTNNPIAKIDSKRFSAFWPANRKNLFHENFCSRKYLFLR